MKLGYDLTIEQSQKLVMTPELIQAIQILQFNTQELEAYVDEQLLANPILEADAAGQDTAEDRADGDVIGAGGDARESSDSGDDFDWSEYLKEREFDDISYRQWEYTGEHN